MIDGTRVQKVVNQINELTAADMKHVAKFGRVKGYSQKYLELKESLRSMIGIARNLYDIDLEDEFKDIEPITFTGMIPNATFNKERRQVVRVGEKLVDLMARLSPEQTKAAAGKVAAEDEAALAAQVKNPRIYVSTPADLPVIGDLKRCLTTADCKLVEADGPNTASKDYRAAKAAAQVKLCQGAVICFVRAPKAPEPAAPKSGPALSQVSNGSGPALAAAKGAENKSQGAGSLAASADSAKTTPAKPTGGRLQRAGSTESNLAVVKFDHKAVEEKKEEKPEDEELARLTQNVLIELGMALSKFPERTYLVVDKELVKELPASVRDLVSFETNGNQLSFEEGQTLVQTFKKPDWAKR